MIIFNPAKLRLLRQIMTEGLPTPLPRKPISPGYQFMILIGLLMGTMFDGSFIGIGIVTMKYCLQTVMDITQAKLGSPNAVSALWLLQFFGTTIPILITQIIFAYLLVKEPDDYLKHHYHFP